MTIFLASLAGVPPLAGWFAKFVMFQSALQVGDTWATILAVIAAVNSVIAFFYYANVIRAMWFHEPAAERPLADPRARRARRRDRASPSSVTVVVGIYPQVFARVGELAF